MRSLLLAALAVLTCDAGMHPSGLERSGQALDHRKIMHLLQPKRIVWRTGDIYVMSIAPPSPRSSVGGMQAYARARLARHLLARHLKKRNDQRAVSMEIVLCTSCSYYFQLGQHSVLYEGHCIAFFASC